MGTKLPAKTQHNINCAGMWLISVTPLWAHRCNKSLFYFLSYWLHSQIQTGFVSSAFWSLVDPKDNRKLKFAVPVLQMETGRAAGWKIYSLSLFCQWSRQMYQSKLKPIMECIVISWEGISSSRNPVTKKKKEERGGWVICFLKTF